MPDPAKLELLTRSDDDLSFDVVEIDSDYVYWSFKPRRLPPTEWELTPQPLGMDGQRNYVVKNLRHERYLLLDDKEFFLWEFFDGRHSIEEIARALHLSAGAFDYSFIRRLLAKLHECSLLETQVGMNLQRSLATREQRWTNRLKARITRWRGVNLKIPGADRLCSTLYDYGGFLLILPITFWAAVALALFALGNAARDTASAESFAYALKTQPVLLTSVMLAAPLAVSALHVLIHALACKAHGRKVREIGFFLLQGVLPTFYADVTDIFMSSRRARITVDLAGPMVEVILGSVALISAHASLPGIGQALLFGVGIMLWESALLNLYPFNFLEMDGYNILADLLAMPMLRQQALTLIRDVPRRLKSARSIERAEWIQLGYLILCLVSVTIYLIAHLDAVRALFKL